MEVLIFDNTNVAFIKDGKQQSKLQTSLLLLYVKFLEENGIDPTKVNYKFQWYGTSKNIKVFKTPNGYNWHFKIL